MSTNQSLSKAARAWLIQSHAPEGVEVEVIDMESGYGAARRIGLAHRFADGVILRAGDEERIAAIWLCGASTVDALELDADGDDERCVTCELAAALPNEPSVYRAWNAEGVLMYVGSTTSPPQRIRTHMVSTRWWSEVARLEVEPHGTEAKARRAEAEAIREEPGIYNREFKRRPRKSPTGVLPGVELTVRGESR